MMTTMAMRRITKNAVNGGNDDDFSHGDSDQLRMPMRE